MRLSEEEMDMYEVGKRKIDLLVTEGGDPRGADLRILARGVSNRVLEALDAYLQRVIVKEGYGT